MNKPETDLPTRPALSHQVVVLTGAAGALGRALAAPLRADCQRLILSDLAGPLARLNDPQAVPCDLADAAAVHALLDGVDAVVHLGGVSVEGPFEPILQANIRGVHNLYEAARRQGVRRIVFASSNHVSGCYRQDERVGPLDPPRPDGNYGISKLFGEGVASLYWHRYGIETVSLRIGTATPAPIDRRSLASWLSPRDLVQLVRCSLSAPAVGHTVAYGVSANPRSWWNSAAAWALLGYVPQDSAEPWTEQVGHLLLPEGPTRELQGGSFLGIGPFDEHDLDRAP
jgi:uronate dehydrogenase